MESKCCIRCGEDRPLDQYYKHPATKDGHLGKCKPCCKIEATANRNKNIDRYREQDRVRGNRQTRAYIEERKSKYPKVAKAHSLVNSALRCGRLSPAVNCESCGQASDLKAHHDDYDFPLSVRWLCQICHSSWHRDNGPGANKE